MSETLNEMLNNAKGLTGKQKSFIEYYLVHLEGKQSAILAGYSEKTAEVAASKLLANPKVKNIIDAELDYRREANKATAEKVIEELSELAFNTREINNRDKLKALELLGKHFAVFTERVEQTGETQIKIQLPPELEQQMKRKG